jgi:hypothetical protein
MKQPEPTVHEKYFFFSERKETEVYQSALDMLLSLQLDQVEIEYPDKPDEQFSHINERNKKILLSLPGNGKITSIHGEFSQGGFFDLKGGALSITMPQEQYNFEVVDSMRKLLTPTFPLCIFQNPYIWGVDLCEPYEREKFFETRSFTVRSQHLEDPQIDIFRRDDGIIFKLRFHLQEDHAAIGIDEGVKLLYPIFCDFQDCLKKRSYEGLELLHLYCTDSPAFRRFSPRTKMAIRIKSLLRGR